MVKVPVVKVFTVIVGAEVDMDDCTLPLLMKLPVKVTRNVKVLSDATVRLVGMVKSPEAPARMVVAPPFKLICPDVAVPAKPKVIPAPALAKVVEIVPPVVEIVGVDMVPEVAPRFIAKGPVENGPMVMAEAPVAANATVLLLLLSSLKLGVVIWTAPPPDMI